MLKIIAAGVTALFVIAAPLAYAEQAASQGRFIRVRFGEFDGCAN
jgi:hypothetical protein